MQKLKRKKIARTLGIIIMTALMLLNVQPVSAASSQQIQQNVKSRIDSMLNSICNKSNSLAKSKVCADRGSTTAPTPTTSPKPAPVPTPEPTPSPDPAPTPVANGKLWGAYTGNTASSFTSFENTVGKQADIHAVFVGWQDSFPSDLADPLKDSGKSILIFWEQYGVTLDQIIAGNSDSYIKEFAADAKAYGGQVLLAPFHEMNGDWDPWGGTVGNNTPAKVVSAWRHVHDLFSGANNVKFVWAVNNDSVPDTTENAIANYYPGDAYVDYAAVDGFNFGDPWQTYDQVFSSALSQIKKYSKPILISSMASAQGSQKAAWITDALSKIQSDSSIKGWVWFNENKEQNWLVNSDSASLKAFQAGIK